MDNQELVLKGDRRFAVDEHGGEWCYMHDPSVAPEDVDMCSICGEILTCGIGTESDFWFCLSDPGDAVRVVCEKHVTLIRE